MIALGLIAAGVCQAAVPSYALAPDMGRINLPEHMSAVAFPLTQAVEPDALWQGDAGTAVQTAPQWQASAGKLLVGRLTLTGGNGRDVYVVHVPAAWLDEVQVWQRPQGGTWRSARAGDLVPLSQWPFAGQSPAFTLTPGELPLDLMVVIANNSYARAPAWLRSDPDFRENQVRQVNLSGLIMGLGLMVVVVTLISAMFSGRRASWLLAGVSAWVMLTIMCINGFMAVWFTPEWPAFNDASKHFSGVMLVSLIVALTAESLDQRFLSRPERLLKLVVPLGGLAYVIVQMLWLPGAWRPPGALLWTLIVFACCMVLCGLSALRGGRYVRWIVAAVTCFGLGVTLVYTPFDFVGGLDLRAAAVGTLFFASMLLYHQALFVRERYGRDVLGRAAVAASRDPLTALLSFQGFQQVYDQVLLRQGAGRGQASVLLFLLPGLEQSGIDHGFVLTERIVVRFAASLQSLFGDAWSIGRLNKTRFACIRMSAGDDDVLALATQVLANVARFADTLGPAAELDLRIACTQRRLGNAGLKALLVELDSAASNVMPPKRIVMV